MAAQTYQEECQLDKLAKALLRHDSGQHEVLWDGQTKDPERRGGDWYKVRGQEYGRLQDASVQNGEPLQNSQPTILWDWTVCREPSGKRCKYSSLSESAGNVYNKNMANIVRIYEHCNNPLIMQKKKPKKLKLIMQVEYCKY